MRFDIHFRSDIKEMINGVVEEIREWNVQEGLAANNFENLAEQVTVFEHCARPDRPFLMGGADGSGDFPCVAYGDSVVYFVMAIARLYKATSEGRLVEQPVDGAEIREIAWMPQDKKKAALCIDDAFERIVGESLEDVCNHSDYYGLTCKYGKRLASPEDLIPHMIHPDAHDAENLRVQLLSTAEPASLIRMMKSNTLHQHDDLPVYILQDSTLSIPLVASASVLYHEVVKRYACTYARENGFIYMTISKSHNLPHMDMIEQMVKEKFDTTEHWFLRIPMKSIGENPPDYFGTRQLPPHGAVTYIFRLHKTTQPMRLDMDYEYWKTHVWNEDKAIMKQNEIQIFRDLDFASLDQRCYGYPYPIKACHDVASLTNDERVALRKQIIDAAVQAGLKRKNFVDPGIPTGHK